MAALHFPVANQINANVAGMTGFGESPVASAKTATEHFVETVRTDAGGLGYLFGHTIENAVETPLERATQAVRGQAGGLVPSDSTNFPGAAAISKVEGVLPTPLVDTVRSDWQRIRSRLGF